MHVIHVTVHVTTKVDEEYKVGGKLYRCQRASAVPRHHMLPKDRLSSPRCFGKLRRLC